MFLSATEYENLLSVNLGYKISSLRGQWTKSCCIKEIINKENWVVYGCETG